MDLRELIDGLSRPAAYPMPVDAVEIRQTHISVVFLVDDFVYKIRKPVRFGFLDFSTLDLRHRDCEEEVRLNRRLAPDVYLGVVGVSVSPDGPRFDEQPVAPVEWAVKMRRLPDSASLLEHLRRGELTEAHVTRLAEVVAGFHRVAGSGPAVAACGRLDVVARNARDNFTQSEPEVGVTVTRPVFERICALNEEAIAELGPLIESRAGRGVPRETHGDLHLDHVYLFPERAPPGDLVIIDCVEFNEQFRYSDPVADMAFLVMDLKYRGRRDLATTLAESYFRASGDNEGRQLLPFYVAYRAAVRAKVEGMTLREPEVSAADRERNRRSAQGHWLLALGELESPPARPALLLIGGLPGTGKSTLARELAGDDIVLIRSDEVRKELFGSAGPVALGEGAYSAAATDRVYAECRRRAEAALLDGRRVIVDANLRDESHREPFRALARDLGVPTLFVVCEADPEAVRERLARRQSDASEADYSVYLWAAERWVAPHATAENELLVVDTTTGIAPALTAVRDRLRSADLY